MIVCSCHAVSEADLRRLAHAGASPSDVARLTAAGTSCGCCASTVQALVERERAGCARGGRCEGCTSQHRH